VGEGVTEQEKVVTVVVVVENLDAAMEVMAEVALGEDSVTTGEDGVAARVVTGSIDRGLGGSRLCVLGATLSKFELLALKLPLALTWPGGSVSSASTQRLTLKRPAEMVFPLGVAGADRAISRIVSGGEWFFRILLCATTLALLTLTPVILLLLMLLMEGWVSGSVADEGWVGEGWVGLGCLRMLLCCVALTTLLVVRVETLLVWDTWRWKPASPMPTTMPDTVLTLEMLLAWLVDSWRSRPGLE
jgi:hypothetical protein